MRLGACDPFRLHTARAEKQGTRIAKYAETKYANNIKPDGTVSEVSKTTTLNAVFALAFILALDWGCLRAWSSLGFISLAVRQFE